MNPGNIGMIYVLTNNQQTRVKQPPDMILFSSYIDDFIRQYTKCSS